MENLWEFEGTLKEFWSKFCENLKEHLEGILKEI